MALQELSAPPTELVALVATPQAGHESQGGDGPDGDGCDQVVQTVQVEAQPAQLDHSVDIDFASAAEFLCKFSHTARSEVHSCLLSLLSVID